VVAQKRRNKEQAKVALIDVALVEDLIGNQGNAFGIFEGTIPTEDFLLADAKAKQIITSIELIHTRRFLSSFWMGDYVKANKFYDEAISMPSSKMPKLWTLYREFFRGIIAFHLYLQGEGEEWLEEGKAMLQKFELLSKVSRDIYESKRLLLQAEFHACLCEIRTAKILFEASIRSAGDHGCISEQGLAIERYGNFLVSVVENTEALNCFKSAHMSYVQWGALALADNVWKKYNLDQDASNGGIRFSTSDNKHGRSW
jgi:hypothetical protein